MEHYDLVLVGSDEVWSPKHAWYGTCPIFYGEGVRTDSLAAYATSFGGHPASEGIDAVRAEQLRSFDAISVRDENSRSIVRDAIGRDVPIVLDPCLHFPINAAPVRHLPRGPYVAVYGYRFSEPFTRAVQQWARTHRLPIISIGYRNDWADQNWLTAGPDDFAHFMAGARAVATNFFHGCVFALRHAIRYGAYLGGMVLAVGASDRRLGVLPGTLLLAGAIGYLRRPLLRLAITATSPGDFMRCAPLLPLVRVVGDVAKMVGYPVGLWWRYSRGLPTHDRRPTTVRTTE
jgi:hypothetical protein